MKIDLHIGDARRVLRSLPAESVDCVVTSPPYWALRNYGVAGQLGLERTPTRYVARMRSYLREIHRVLKPTGTLWLNLGDCHYSPRLNGGVGKTSTLNGSKHAPLEFRDAQRAMRSAPNRGSRIKGLKPKSLVGIPWRIAFAMMHDPKVDWYLRMDNVWHKPNTMPESPKDRPTKDHEYVFFFSKSQRYWYDADAVKERASPDTHSRVAVSPVGVAPGQPRSRPQGVHPKAIKRGNNGVGWGYATGEKPRTIGLKPIAGWVKGPGRHETVDHATKADVAEDAGARSRDGRKFGREPGWRTKQNDSFAAHTTGRVLYRNKRSVWRIPTEPYKGAHFATFPTRLVEPCILAGCPPDGVVLDPFGGAGTVALVAARNHRRSILIELSPKYGRLAAQRLVDELGLFQQLIVHMEHANVVQEKLYPASPLPERGHDVPAGPGAEPVADKKTAAD